MEAPGWNLSTKIDTLNLSIINVHLCRLLWDQSLKKLFAGLKKSKEQENHKLARIQRSKNNTLKTLIKILYQKKNWANMIHYMRFIFTLKIRFQSLLNNYLNYPLYQN